MKPTRMTVAATVIALAAAACGEQQGAAASDREPPPTTAEPAPTRAAIPVLFDIMMDLQTEMARVDRGIWSARYDTVEAGARGIATHRRISADEQRVLRSILGDDVVGFNERDDALHELALRLEEAAGEGAMRDVLEAAGEVRRACVECHAEFRPRLRQGVR